MIVSASINKREEQSMKSIQKWTVGGLLTAGLVVVGFVAAASGLWAQNPGIKRKVVFTGDVSVPGPRGQNRISRDRARSKRRTPYASRR